MNRESNIDSKGQQHKGEANNMEDLLRAEEAGKRISTVVRAVKYVKEDDRIDRKIIERITNLKDKSHGRMRHHIPTTGTNIDFFIAARDAFKNGKLSKNVSKHLSNSVENHLITDSEDEEGSEDEDSE